MERCYTCREKAVAAVEIPYATDITHDGRVHHIEIDSLAVRRCGSCGAIVLDDAADDRITDSLRRAACLLAPEEIAAQRTTLGLSREQLAAAIDEHVATIERLESGDQLPTRALDKLLRLFFKYGEVRRELGCGPAANGAGPHPKIALAGGASAMPSGS